MIPAMNRFGLAVLTCLTIWAATPEGQTAPTGHRVLEIRSYNLKLGTRDAFHKLFLDESLPMLHRWKIDVVAFGPSTHDADSYFLMRSFPSLEERQRIEDAFYGSEEWLKGPRERVLAPIISYTTVTMTVDEATLNGLRATMR